VKMVPFVYNGNHHHYDTNIKELLKWSASELLVLALWA